LPNIDKLTFDSTFTSMTCLVSRMRLGVDMQAIHDGPRVNRRLAIISLFALVASLLVGGFGAKPAFADSTICSGNDWTTCPSAGYTDHGYGTNSNNMYWGMYSGHNCTNYVA